MAQQDSFGVGTCDLNLQLANLARRSVGYKKKISILTRAYFVSIFGLWS